jgi:hypothetical protein
MRGPYLGGKADHFGSASQQCGGLLGMTRPDPFGSQRPKVHAPGCFTGCIIIEDPTLKPAMKLDRATPTLAH